MNTKMSIKTLDKYNLRPMEEEEVKIFLQATMIEWHVSEYVSGNSKPEEIRNFGDLPAQAKMILSRWARVDSPVVISLACLVFISSLCDRPGTAILWAHSIHRHFIENKLEKYTLGEFAEIFPYGIPDYISYREAWKNQKVSEDYGQMVGMASDNYLDYKVAWE